MVFFLVFYAILTYSLVAAAQQSVTLAAQEGARKVLQWQEGTPSLAVRANAGRDAALYQAQWISSMSASAVQVAVCGSTGALSSSAGGACSGRALADGQVEVTVSYAYGAHPLIPALPLLQTVLMPASGVLSARATVHLNGER
ncbi:TadE/TadG family type IV pilus assembly protein [Achromobacter sp. UMC46]|uniref:TadE/TadG family type IV pilus assembly protein n=1 Tax=Achromobacter sp. UMC46 TaxID=1862319 RepID=UPI00351CA96A|nr:pilus assembly protein [Achromobacter sp. UMC46]